VYDPRRNEYIGALTFRSLSKALGRDLLDHPVLDYMIQPARVSKDESISTVIQKMQNAAATVAFVFDGNKMVGMITLSDILEQLLGVKV